MFPAPLAQPNARGVGTVFRYAPSPKFQTAPKRALIANKAIGVRFVAILSVSENRTSREFAV